MPSAKYLEEEKISSLLWKFSLPAIAGMLAGACYNVIDSIFVGQGVGMVALAAVTIALPIMTFLMAIGMLIGVGSSTLVSISLGQHKTAQAEQILGNALMMAVIFIIPAVVIVLHFLDPLLTGLLGATPAVLPSAHAFVSIILLASIFLHIGFGLNNVIRAQGSPKTALATQIFSTVLTIILGYLFIFVFHWGISGAAIATAFGQGSSAIWVLAFFVSGKGVLKLRLHNLRPRFSVMKKIAWAGIAPFAMQLSMSAVLVVLNWLVLDLGGDIGVASYGIINRVVMLVVMPVIGLSQGAQPIIGYNFGAEKPQRVLEAVIQVVKASSIVCVILFLALELLAGDIVHLFGSNVEMIAISREGLRIFALMMPFIGLQVVGISYFQAIGKAHYAVVFSLLRQLIVFVPAAYLLSRVLGLDGVWIAAPTADFAAIVITATCMVIDLRRYLNARGYVIGPDSHRALFRLFHRPLSNALPTHGAPVGQCDDPAGVVGPSARIGYDP